MAVTVDTVTDTTVESWNIHVMSFTGYDAANPIGVSTSTNTFIQDGAATLTLASTTRASSAVVGMRHLGVGGATDAAATPGTGWTEIYDHDGRMGRDANASQDERHIASGDVVGCRCQQCWR